MKRSFYSILVCVMFAFNLQATQDPTELENYAGFKVYLDSLNRLSDTMILGKGAENRIKASYAYLGYLETALNAFPDLVYPFDSLRNISVLGDENTKFRIFTWELLFAPNKYRHLGIIHYHTKKKEPIVKVLNDFSDNIRNPQDTVAGINQWYGCFYYKILRKRRKGEFKYYMFGWDMNDGKSYKKVIDVLTFVDDKPIFGAKDFHFTDYNEVRTRFILEYDKHASTTMNYDEDMKLIVFDHMAPIGKSQSGKDDKDILIPDGSYHAFKWKRGKWIFIEKLFHFKLKDGEAPIGR